MYGGYYGMNPGMRGGYGGGPMAQQSPQQPLHMQARMRGPMNGGPMNGGPMNGGPMNGGPMNGGPMNGGPMNGGSMVGGPMVGGLTHSPATLVATGGGGAPMGNNGTNGPQQLNRNASFMMMHNQNSFGGPAAGMRNNAPVQNGGYMGAGPRFGSFSAASNPYQGGSSYSSVGAGSLHRMNSGVNFGYYSTHSQMNLGSSAAPLSRGNSGYTAGMRQGSFMGAPANAGAAGAPAQLSRQNSALGSSYSYGSFRQPSFTQGSAHHGATGLGPNMSTNSIAGGMSQPDFGSTTEPGAMGGGAEREAPTGVSPSSLARQDSAMALQRSYSIAGQFYSYNNGGMGPNGAAGGGPPPGVAMGGPQRRPSMPMGMLGPAPGMTLTISGIDGRMSQRPAGQGALSPQQQQMMMHQHMMMQRRLASGINGAEADPSAAPPKGTSENAVVEEGQSMALGRKNSVQNLTRKASEKRVGMYFKNKDVGEVADGSTYKKEGDTGTVGKNNARARDPSLTNTVKASIVLDTSGGANKAITVDGRTIRAEKPGAEEVQKYDMRDVLFANRSSDVELLSDSIEEIRDNFVYGCNVGLIMADAGMSSALPTEWFTWLALKSVVKGTFGKLSNVQFEFTMSVCLLQDDQVMDLLADDPQRFVTLTVAESPLFGNVANGMVYVCVENAGEFNEVLESSLYRAQQQCSTSAEEHGIVLCTCVLKQIRTSPSTGKQDVIVSSIFASGVGSGVIHYVRILDKNPAEPRLLFYSVLHRSVHSTALFSCAARDDEIFNYLAALQRFSKTETRRPKVGSTRAFVSYGTSTIPKIREDLEKAKDPRQRMMLQRQLEKLELMVADAEEILENPVDSVPKTYI